MRILFIDDDGSLAEAIAVSERMVAAQVYGAVA